MKKYLITFLTIILCLGSIPVGAQEVSDLLASPCWYGEAYAVDCVYAVSGGKVDSVTSLLSGNFFEWNYIAQENLLLLAVASASPLPDPAQLSAYMSVAAEPGTTLTLQSLRINGKNADIGFCLTGQVTSFGVETDSATIRLLQDGAVKYTTSAAGNPASYRFDSVKAGEYTMQVSMAGHVTQEIPVTVDSRNTVQDVKLYLLGDVNGDGQINARDARYVLRHAVGYTDAGIVPGRGDVNHDKLVNARDARYILRHAVGYDDNLGMRK